MARPFDLVCFSHLRWDFVVQRPQHLMRRAAEHRRVFFLEEPTFGAETPFLDVGFRERDGVFVGVPRLPDGLTEDVAASLQRALVDRLFREAPIERFVAWYYTPMALRWSRHLEPLATVYDCMDELSGFAGAPAALGAFEDELFARADVVFTGGQSLYEAKRTRHAHVHAMPSSVDRRHFARTLSMSAADEPPDQAGLPRPRAGWYGVIDERMDLALVAGLADALPRLQLVMLGPVVKIDPASLPQRPNLHWLGARDYASLPAYLAGWDVALLPFAHNAATRFISPTKTPEYLAAGRAVVSTSVLDVVRPWAEAGVVRIGDGVTAFAAAVRDALAEPAALRHARAEPLLARTSWDATWAAMLEQLDAAVLRRAHTARRPPLGGARLGVPTPPPDGRPTQPIHHASK